MYYYALIFGGNVLNNVHKYVIEQLLKRNIQGSYKIIAKNQILFRISEKEKLKLPTDCDEFYLPANEEDGFYIYPNKEYDKDTENWMAITNPEIISLIKTAL